jgi:hypothetical protein
MNKLPSNNDDSLLRPPGERARQKEQIHSQGLEENPFENMPEDPLEILQGEAPKKSLYSNERDEKETEEEEKERHRRFAMGEETSNFFFNKNIEPEIIATDTTNAVEIHLETEGRFNTPAIIYVKDYDVEGLNSIANANEDNFIETLAAVLNRQLLNGVRTEEMLHEEFLEVLYALKQKYSGLTTHKHYWVHRCPDREFGEEPKLSEFEIPLFGENSLKTRSITEAENALKKVVQEAFAQMTPEEYSLYLQNKYDTPTFHSKEEELKRISIREPFTIRDGNDRYKFRFARIKDTIKAQREASIRFSPKLRAIKSKQVHGMNPAELKNLKDEEIKKINQEKLKFVAIYSKAQTLISKNGKILNDQEKYEIYRRFSREAVLEMAKYFELISFGLHDKRTLTCNLCGGTEVRSLHRDFHPIEFIPVEDRNTKLDSSSKLGVHSKVNIYFGV